MSPIPEISAAEFQILKVLWKYGAQSVREVHDKTQPTTAWAYSTTKTTMDRMVKKELLQRQSFHGVFIYKHLISKSQGLVKWVRFFADGVLETDYSNVVSMFSQNGTLSASEIKELQALLETNEEAVDE
jgi:BlaI family transcriptional regulator, penicillinase repressor